MQRMLLATVFLLLLAGSHRAGGNVTVTITAEGDLLVVGDDVGNLLRIDGLDGPPFLLAGGSGTTLNGSTMPIDVTGVRGKFLFDLGGGDDYFNCDGPAGTEAWLEMGDGDDVLILGQTGAARLFVDLGEGDDRVDLEDSSFGDALILGGSGHDLVDLVFCCFGDLVVCTDKGDDLVRGWYSYFTGNVRFEGGAGRDILAMLGPEYLGGPPKILGFEPGQR